MKTPQEIFADAMREIVEPSGPRPGFISQIDVEISHIQMDNLMCDLLESLGYGDGVNIFRDAAKWYS